MTTSASEILAAEASVRYGEVPKVLKDALTEAPTFAISSDAFQLKLPSGLKFHYQRGNGVIVSKPENISDSEVLLFLNGSVYGAIAWLNGYVPLHASGVVHDRKVYAFTGNSGAGKSTLAAALGSRGFPLQADDVLVLDLNAPNGIVCLPGHKQIKLWGDALELTGATAEARVRPDLDKFYALPPAGLSAEPLPFAHLSFLEDRASQPIETPISGIERFTRARTAFYRPRFYNSIVEKMDLFSTIERISRQIPMSRFDRPRGSKQFDKVADFAAAVIQSNHG